jgi:type IV secretory pathway VirB10-like protein
LPSWPSKKLYYAIGGGVAAVVVLGVILAFALSGDSKPEGTAGRTPPPPAISAPKPSPDEERKAGPKEPEPKPPEAKAPEPKPPDEYDPRAAVAASLLEQAKAYLRAHPEDPAGYRDKLADLTGRYARTPAAEEAARLVAGLKIPEKPTVGDLPRSEALLRPNETVADYAKRMNLAPETSLDLGGGVKVEFVLVPAGEFMMGSEDPDAKPGEKPVHKVRISKPFYMGKYEVTVAEFRAFAEATRYQTEAEKSGTGWGGGPITAGK